MRGITGGNISDRGAVRGGLSPQSYGEHSAIAPFRNSGTPGAAANGVAIETESVVKGRNYPRAQSPKKKEVGQAENARTVTSVVPRRPNKTHGSHCH